MLPTLLQDQSTLIEVSLPTWRSLFDACGEPTRFRDRSFSHQELTPSFVATPPGATLFAAISLIQEMGTDDGRTHIEQVAADMQIAFDRALSSHTARELIAHLAIRSQSEAAFADLLIRAQMTFRSVDSSRVSRLFVGSGDATAEAIDEQDLKTGVSQWCAAHGKSEVVSVLAQKYNGDWLCQVVRGDPLKLVPEIRERTVGTLVYTPAATDLLRYEPRTGRIHISTRSPQLVDAYRGVLGTLVAGNAQYFSGESICSLRALQEKGNGLFEANRVPGIEHVAVTDLFWQKTNHGKVWVTGKDCFHVLADLQANLSEGELREARLRIEFTGGGRGRVTLKTPNIIEIKADPNQHLVEQLLDRTGLRGAFDIDGAARNFWDQYPWQMKEPTWRRRLGGDFDRLVSDGVLRDCVLETVTHPDHPGASNALDVVQVSPTVAMGVSTNAAIGVRTLTTSDRQGYELQVPHLVEHIKSALGLEGNCAEISLGTGLWRIGVRALAPNAKMTGFVALRTPGPTASALIAQAATGTTPLLLYPHDCNGIAGIASLACRLPQGPFYSLLGDAVVALGWQSIVPPSVWSAAELVVDLIQGAISFRGVHLALDVSSRSFKFGVILAKAQGAPVTHAAICEQISPSRPDAKNFAKDTKREFVEAIDAAFDSAGRQRPQKDSVVGNPRHAYNLKVPAYVHS